MTFLALLRSCAARLTAARLLAGARWAWANRTPILAVLAVLFVALYLRSAGRAARAEAAAEAAAVRATEEGKIRKADVPVVQVVPQPVVNDEAERALAERPELLAERDRLKREVGKLRATLVIRGETAPVPASGAPRPGDLVPGDIIPPPVLLREGDPIRFSLAGVGLEGPKGAQALLLSVGVARAADGVELGRGPLSVPLTSAFRPPAPCETPVPERRWRAGPLGGVSTSGWVAGAAGTYRLRIWGWMPEGIAQVTAGPGGGLLAAGFLF